MKATRILRHEQELIDRFLAVFGLGAVKAAQNKPVQPGFFMYGCGFIKEFIEGSYFKKRTGAIQRDGRKRTGQR